MRPLRVPLLWGQLLRPHPRRFCAKIRSASGVHLIACTGRLAARGDGQLQLSRAGRQSNGADARIFFQQGGDI